MTVHFQRELTGLRARLLSQAAIIEEGIAQAIRALKTRDLALAEAVIAGDDQIDQREIEIEEECLKILALHQPVATDLRFIVAVLKMNNDLERMGDLTTSIAKRARWLARHDPIPWPYDVGPIADNVRAMVRGCLDALIEGDADKARAVCSADDQVDRMKRELIKIVRAAMREQPENANVLLRLLDVPRHLERIADLTTNIAEDVIYLVEGRIARHMRPEEHGEGGED